MSGQANVFLPHIPFPGQQAAVSRVGVSFIQQQHHSPVRFGPNDPARRLQNLLHGGNAAGIAKAVAKPPLLVLLQSLAPESGRGQANPYNGYADQLISRQVDALAEQAAQYA